MTFKPGDRVKITYTGDGPFTHLSTDGTYKSVDGCIGTYLFAGEVYHRVRLDDSQYDGVPFSLDELSPYDEKSVPAEPVYEYWVTEEYWQLKPVNEQMKFLNECSLDGWELVTIDSVKARFYMRRKK